MLYLGQGRCLIENTRLFALHLYKTGYQSSINMYKSIRTCTNTSFGQLDEWCKIYTSVRDKQSILKQHSLFCFFDVHTLQSLWLVIKERISR